MDKKIIFLMCFLIFMAWSVGGLSMGQQPAPDQSAFPPQAAAEPAAINPYVPGAQQGWPRQYTGIIKNKSNCDVSLYSRNSDATLIIPAHSWIEYSAWVPHFPVTAYCDGKPFYCLNICANPSAYPFMCKKYDFMVEIPGKYEGRQWHPGKKLKRRVRRMRAVG
ncbi:MAG: hypothetical protein WBW52_00710 [Desulfobaccales bacterium]